MIVPNKHLSQTRTLEPNGSPYNIHHRGRVTALQWVKKNNPNNQNNPQNEPDHSRVNKINLRPILNLNYSKINRYWSVQESLLATSVSFSLSLFIMLFSFFCPHMSFFSFRGRTEIQHQKNNNTESKEIQQKSSTQKSSMMTQPQNVYDSNVVDQSIKQQKQHAWFFQKLSEAVLRGDDAVRELLWDKNRVTHGGRWTDIACISNSFTQSQYIFSNSWKYTGLWGL